jgi:hypothetical protein
MRAFLAGMLAAVGIQPQVRRPAPPVPLVRDSEDEKERLRRAWLCSRTSSKPFAERQKIRSERAKLEEPRRIRKAARAARKANRS